MGLEVSAAESCVERHVYQFLEHDIPYAQAATMCRYDSDLNMLRCRYGSISGKDLHGPVLRQRLLSGHALILDHRLESGSVAFAGRGKAFRFAPRVMGI